MITSLTTSFLRVLLTWYVLGCLFLSIGRPIWAESLYADLTRYPWVPALKFEGIWSALDIKINLLLYWTIPALAVWLLVVLSSFAVPQLSVLLKGRHAQVGVKPTGAYHGVNIPPADSKVKCNTC